MDHDKLVEFQEELESLKTQLQKKQELVDQLGNALEWYIKCEVEGFSLTNDPFPSANAAIIAWKRDTKPDP